MEGKAFNDQGLLKKLTVKGDLFPPETRRCSNLIGRSPTAREVWLLDPLLRILTKKFVDKTTSNFYGESKHTYTSEAICGVAASLVIGPGAKAQRLHRDDKNYHMDHEDQITTGYRVGSDAMLGFLIAGTQTTYANGATLAVPGSHLCGPDRAPLVSEAAYAEMDPGDAFVMLGGCYHAGGANQTTDQWRSLHGIFFIRGYMRPEENVFLCNTNEEVLKWSPEAAKLMGYSMSSPNIGAVLFKQPLDYIRGEEVDVGDFDTSQEKSGWKSVSN